MARSLAIMKPLRTGRRCSPPGKKKENKTFSYFKSPPNTGYRKATRIKSMVDQQAAAVKTKAR